MDLSHSVIRSQKPLEIMKEAGLDPVEVATIPVNYKRAEAQAAVRIAKNLVDGRPAGEDAACTVSDECENIYYVPFEKVTAENAQDYVADK